MAYNYKTELGKYRRYYQSLEPVLLKTKNQTYTTIVFSFLTVSLFGWYAIRPTVQTILYLKREISDKTELSKKMEEKITNLIYAQSAYEQLEPFLPNVEQALPPDPNAIPLIVQFRNLARENDVALSGVQLPATPLIGKEATRSSDKTGGQQAFDFTISVIGDYPSLQNFLEGMRTMRRVVTIEGMSISQMRLAKATGSESAETESRLLQLTLKLKSYFLIGK